jgi:hypothetical protein
MVEVQSVAVSSRVRQRLSLSLVVQLARTQAQEK